MENITIWLAFGAGILSFVSPCCLPLYPSYISYITGISVSQLQGEQRSGKIKKLTMIHTLFFIIGFSIIRIILEHTHQTEQALQSQKKVLIEVIVEKLSLKSHEWDW